MQGGIAIQVQRLIITVLTALLLRVIAIRAAILDYNFKSMTMPAGIITADGNCWEYVGKNDEGWILIRKLTDTMGFSKMKPPPTRGKKTTGYKRIQVEASSREVRWADLPEMRKSGVFCRVGPFAKPGKLALQMARISQIVVSGSERKGGLLLHGALAEWNGQGVILAGPGGVGKSTAIGRLPRPWLALSDDAALIVRAPEGSYWVHPWPTWSRIGRGKENPSWDVQKAVQLKLIFILTQNKRDGMRELPYLQAFSELVDSAGQASVILANGLEISAYRRINLTRFHNAEAIAKRVPVFRLQASLDGKFWKGIEKTLVALNECRIMNP